MIIKRISLEDFGILRNQILDNLHCGLVVIAGGNRAGKTTLMTALRYLGYGFPKRTFIPPASGTQQIVSADALLHTGEKYNIKLEGYGAPKVSPLDNSSTTTIQEIFGGVDSYTYRQIFTISLEELRRIPEDTDNQGEQHLQAILLGGGWADALKLIQIRQEFGKEANNIAGKNGAKGTRQFKPFSQTIARGLELRQEANSQIEKFHALETDIVREKAELEGLEKELKQRAKEQELHELIRDHWENYHELVMLESFLGQEENKNLQENFPRDGADRSKHLLEEFAEAYRDHEFLQNQFATNIGSKKQQLLLQNTDRLELYAKELSGWREKATALEANLHDHREAREDMTGELAQLHSNWGDNLNLLNNLPLDLVNEEQILKLVDNVAETEDLLKACNREIRQYTLSLKHKKEQAEALHHRKAGIPKKIVIFSALGIVLVLVVANLFGPGAAAGTGLVAGAGILGYILHNYLGANASPRELIINQVEDIKSHLSVLEKQQQDLNQTSQERHLELKNMLRALGLPEDLPYSAVPDFVRGAKSLKKRYQSWLVKSKEISTQQGEQNRLLQQLEMLLDELGLMQAGIGAEASPSYLFNGIETACSYLSAAQELKTSEVGISKLETEIMQLLEEASGLIKLVPDTLASDKVSQEVPRAPFPSYAQALQTLLDKGLLFQELQQKQQTLVALKTGLLQTLNTPKNKVLLNAPHDADAAEFLNLFERASTSFSSKDEAAASCQQLAEETQNLRGVIADKARKIPVMESELTQLASEAKLLEANREITEARQGLEFKAQEYAVNRLAELITEDLYRQLMQETKTKVLDTAGDLFSKITSKEYAFIDLLEDGSNNDFLAYPGGKTTGIPPWDLSRGTSEQLFLSVRLSRIRGIKPPLPVILDDSLANFDPTHTRETVRLLADLAETNQIFVLTCHPELIQWIEETGCEAQYWGLEKGAFSGPYGEPTQVIDLLAAD